jgi:hypothetical protein
MFRIADAKARLVRCIGNPITLEKQILQNVENSKTTVNGAGKRRRARQQRS